LALHNKSLCRRQGVRQQSSSISSVSWNLVAFGSVITPFVSEPITLAFPHNFKVFRAKHS
jgi:hypothetical protein